MAFARLLFPTEAKLAMDIANAETTSEFSGLSASKGSSGNLREVDLNETPIMQNKRLRSRLEALMKTGNRKLLSLLYIWMPYLLLFYWIAAYWVILSFFAQWNHCYQISAQVSSLANLDFCPRFLFIYLFLPKWAVIW